MVSTEPRQTEPAQPDAPLQPEVTVDTAAADKPKRSGCRSCAIGCLVTLSILVLVVLLGAGWFFNWPQRWGLVASPAEEFFESGVNPYASDALAEELASQGLSMEGVSIYVIPAEDPSDHVAYILVDATQGASWRHDTYRSAAEGFMILAATTQAADTYSIQRVAVDHRDEQGIQAAVVTAPTPVLQEYAAGGITQQELFDQMDAYMDMAGALKGMSE